MAHAITDFQLLTFDCYGTLIDWETGIWDALQPLLMENGADHPSREEALTAFAGIQSRQEADTPGMIYSQVLETAHRGLARHFDLKTTVELDRGFAASIPLWPAFPDTADALRRLKRRFRLAVLSNVHREGFAASNRKLGVAFDAVWTAQDIGSYKPDPRNFEFMLRHAEDDLGVAKDGILHTAQSLYHDHVQAGAFGLANCWIDRRRLAEGGKGGVIVEVDKRPRVDFRFATLGAMADTL